MKNLLEWLRALLIMVTYTLLYIVGIAAFLVIFVVALPFVLIITPLALLVFWLGDEDYDRHS